MTITHIWKIRAFFNIFLVFRKIRIFYRHILTGNTFEYYFVLNIYKMSRLYKILFFTLMQHFYVPDDSWSWSWRLCCTCSKYLEILLYTTLQNIAVEYLCSINPCCSVYHQFVYRWVVLHYVNCHTLFIHSSVSRFWLLHIKLLWKLV